MAHIVVMPALGNTVESCLVTTWLVSEGDTVDPQTTLCEIETDKSAMDVPAGVSGTVLRLLAEEGDEVPVKAPLVVVGEPGESVEDALASAGVEAPASDAGSVPTVSGEGGERDERSTDALAPAASPSSADDSAATPAVTGEAGEVDETREDNLTPRADGAPAAVSPRARATAERAGASLAGVQGTGPHGRVIERDVTAAVERGPRPTAATRGADLEGATGSGIGGRVTRADLSEAAGQRPAGVAAAAASGGADRAFPGASTDTPLKGVRKIIAERMLNALVTSAQLTYNTSARAAGLLALRARFKASDPELGFTGITIGDLVCFATVRALGRHASLNAHLSDGVLRTFEGVHLGLAVDTPRGLLVPTIRHADRMGIRELSATTKELAGQCQNGKIDPELLAGATFTVSNLGSFGIESFTPIINVPQTGILGVDAIGPRATLNPDGTPGVEMRIGLSLTADHQAVDGADAARFLADVVRFVENIDLAIAG